MSFYNGVYNESKPVVKTTTHVVCPACNKPDQTIDHLLGQKHNTETMWYCDQCGARYALKVTTDGKVFTHTTPDRFDPCIVILRNKEVVLVVKGMQFNGADGPGHHEYFYDEHTCPTNYMKSVKAVIALPDAKHPQVDTDPHGIFQYVTTLPWDAKLEDCNNGDWLRATILPHVPQQQPAPACACECLPCQSCDHR